MSFLKKLFGKKKGGSFVGNLWRGILNKPKPKDNTFIGPMPNYNYLTSPPDEQENKPLISIGGIMNTLFGSEKLDLGKYFSLPAVKVEASEKQNQNIVKYGIFALIGFTIFKALTKKRNPKR